MKLAEYLSTRKISFADFADRIGVKRQSVYRYAAEERSPDNKTMKAIIEATEGAVTPYDFMGIAPPTAPDDERETAA